MGSYARLLPFNGVLTLLHPDEYDMPTPLADAGLRVLRIGVPVSTEAGDIEVDVLAGNVDGSILVPMECKGGKNFKKPQARGYAAAQWDELVRDAGLDVDATEGEVVVAYVGGPDAAELLQNIEAASSVLDLPVIGIGENEVRLHGAPSHEILQFDPQPVDLPWPVWLPVDEESSEEEYLDAIAAEVVGTMRDAHDLPSGQAMVTYEDLYRRVVPIYDVLDPVLQRAVAGKVRVAARALPHEAPRFFMEAVTEDGQNGLAIVRTPEDLKLQGRTQQWQQLKRLLADVDPEEGPQSSLFGGEP